MVQKPEKALTAKAVGREFVRQYYTMLAKEPKYLHRFYGSNSEMLHGAKDEQVPAIGQVKIREKIKSLCFRDCHTKVAQLDAFITIGNGIVIQVAGEISNNQQPLRRFMQTFVLGPQEREGADPGTSFYVHNDIFRYQDDIFDDVADSGNGDNELTTKMDVNGVSYEHQITSQPADNGDAASAAVPAPQHQQQSPPVPPQQSQPTAPPPQQQQQVPPPQQQQPQMVPQQYMSQQQMTQSVPPPMQQQSGPPMGHQVQPPVQQQQQMPPVAQQQPQQTSQVIEETNQVETTQYEEVTIPKNQETQQINDYNTNHSVDEVASATDSLNMKEPEAAPEEVKVESAPVTNAPLSWAARMRSGAGGNVGPMLTPSQMPPLQATLPKPPKVEPKVEPPAVVETAEDVPPQRSGPNGPSNNMSGRDMNQSGSREFNSMRGGGDRRRDGDREDYRDRPRFQNDDRHQIFVGGLPPNMTEENIRTTFAQFGTIKYVRMNQNTNSRPGAGFGFVTFSSEAEAQEALNNRNSIFFQNLQLNIEEKKTKNPGPGGSGSGGPHRGGPRDSRDGTSRGSGKYGDSGRGRGGGQYQSRDNQRPGQRGGPPGSGPGDKYRRDRNVGRQNY